MKKSKKIKIITSASTAAIVSTIAPVAATAFTTNTSNEATSITNLQWFKRSMFYVNDDVGIKDQIIQDNSNLFAKYRKLKQAIDIDVAHPSEGNLTITISIKEAYQSQFTGTATWSATYPTTPEVTKILSLNTSQVPTQIEPGVTVKSKISATLSGGGVSTPIIFANASDITFENYDKDIIDENTLSFDPDSQEISFTAKTTAPKSRKVTLCIRASYTEGEKTYGATSTVVITVYAVPVGIDVNCQDLTFNYSGISQTTITQPCKATITDGSGSSEFVSQDVSWTLVVKNSEQTEVQDFSIWDDGNITFSGNAEPGEYTATATATCKEVTTLSNDATFKITVNYSKPTSVTITSIPDETELTFEAGVGGTTTTACSATVSPTTYAKQEVNWSITDTSGSSINGIRIGSDGKITVDPTVVANTYNMKVKATAVEDETVFDEKAVTIKVTEKEKVTINGGLNKDTINVSTGSAKSKSYTAEVTPESVSQEVTWHNVGDLPNEHITFTDGTISIDNTCPADTYSVEIYAKSVVNNVESNHVTVTIIVADAIADESSTTGPSELTVAKGASNITDEAFLCTFYKDKVPVSNVTTQWQLDYTEVAGVDISMDSNNKILVNAKEYQGDPVDITVNVSGTYDGAPTTFTATPLVFTIHVVNPATNMIISTTTGSEYLVAEIGTVYTVSDPYEYEFKDGSGNIVYGVPIWDCDRTGQTYAIPTDVGLEVNSNNQLVIDTTKLSAVPSTNYGKFKLSCSAEGVTGGTWNQLEITVYFVPNTTTNRMTYNGTNYTLPANFDLNNFCVNPNDESITSFKIPVNNEQGYVEIPNTAEARANITSISIPSVDPNTTNIPEYFMDGFGISKLDLSGVPENTTVQKNFLRHCDNLTFVDMGKIKASDMNDSGENDNQTFFTVEISTVTAYTTGLGIFGDDYSAIRTKFASRLVGTVTEDYRNIGLYINYITKTDGTVVPLYNDLNNFTAGSGFCTSGTNFTNLKAYDGSVISSVAKSTVAEVVINQTASSVSIITSYFLANCTHLTKVDLSGLSNVKTIYGAFLSGCTSLTTVDLTGLENVESIGTTFLEGCTGLLTLDLSPLKSVNTIAESFLKDCKSLVSLDMSQMTSLEYNTSSTDGTIGKGFLAQCNSLISLYVPLVTSATPKLGSSAGSWGVAPKLQYIHCGSQTLIDLYSTADNWKDVKTKASAPNAEYVI